MCLKYPMCWFSPCRKYAATYFELLWVGKNWNFCQVRNCFFWFSSWIKMVKTAGEELFPFQISTTCRSAQMKLPPFITQDVYLGRLFPVRTQRFCMTCKKISEMGQQTERKQPGPCVWDGCSGAKEIVSVWWVCPAPRRCWGMWGCEIRGGKSRTGREPESQGGRRRESLLRVSITMQPRKPQETAKLENNTGGTNSPFKDKIKRGVFFKPF